MSKHNAPDINIRPGDKIVVIKPNEDTLTVFTHCVVTRKVYGVLLPVVMVGINPEPTFNIQQIANAPRRRKRAMERQA